MIDAEVKRAPPAPRIGAQVLALLAVPINAAVLEVLADGPKSLFDLRREVDSPPQTTMRAYLRELVRTGVLTRYRESEFPGNVGYALDEGGHDLVAVAGVVDDWLRRSPEAPAPLGSGAARSALKALTDGWSTSMIRALASGPLSLTELDSIIASVSYPSLERRLGAMRHEGLVEAFSSNGRGTPYGASEWLRQATAPLIAAARWERARLGDEAPSIGSRDVEAAFLLAIPLLRMSSRFSGSCRLVVKLREGGREALAGVAATVRRGDVETCETRLEGNVDSWALGAPEAWFAGVIDGDREDLSFGGKTRLAKAMVEAFHKTLFARS